MGTRDTADIAEHGSAAGTPNSSLGQRTSDPYVGLSATPVRALIRREPITLPPDATIRQAAELMRDERVSSVLVVQGDDLLGIFTDRDLRNKAVAAGVPTDTPVIDVATRAPLTVDVRSTGFEALLLMTRRNIRHVPVLDGQRVVGMISASDVQERQTTSAVFLAGDIHEQADAEGLKRATSQIAQVQRNLAAADATAFATGHVITAITDALTTRLLQLAEAKLGPPPVAYAWVAAGSQARNEQSAKSDQDNCLILDDAYDEATHGVYFKELAKFVCAGLDACGYVFCPGEMMAQTDTWRQPQHVWRRYFQRWVDAPEPMALMLTCVFFDMRLVSGHAPLLDDLRRDVLARTRGNGIFLAHMVSNALKHRPPLGLFGRLATASSGEHRGTIDLKHAGIVPIVDLARVYALAGGHAEVNTHNRLEVAARSGEVSEDSTRDLRDALEYLAVQRIRHQVRRLDAGQPADNHLAPNELSSFERSQLKDAMRVVQTLQSVLDQRYRM